MSEEEIRLDQTKRVFDTLAELISKNETCTYRYLIYDLLGFDGYYSTLMSGLTITNALVDMEDLQQKVEQLKKENNDLRKIYQNTYKKYLENGNEEMARYFMAQIDDCPTFYVEPVIDYYKEYHKLENIRKEAITYILAHCEIIRHKKENVDEVGNVNGADLLNILNKGSDKE